MLLILKLYTWALPNIRLLKLKLRSVHQKRVEGSSAHTNQDHLRTQPRIMCTHKSVSSAHTDQDHLRTRIRTPNQSSSVRWGVVGWGGDNNKPGRFTRTWQLHCTGQTFLSTNIFLWVGGWGGDNNKPGRFTRTWQLHWADFPFYQHLLMGGRVGWGK